MTNNISNLHLDLLDRQRQELLEELIPLAKGFVLGEGTALALQLPHRKPLDFNFFSPSELPKNLLEKVSQKLKIDNIAVDSRDELTFFTDGGIKVTFLYYPFPSNFKLVETENGLVLFPVKQIALQKAYTIGRWGEYRDYFDLYTILKTGAVTLDELMTSAKQI